MNLVRHLSHVCLMLLAVCSLTVSAATTSVTKDAFSILYIDDSNNPLTIDQVKKLPVGMFADSEVNIHKPDTLDFSVWYRISLKAQSDSINEPVSITVDNPTLDNIKYHFIDNEDVILIKQAGDMYETESVLDHVVPKVDLYDGFAHNNVMYIRVKTNGASATPIVIESTFDSTWRSSAQLMLLGCFVGVVMIMMIYNFFIFRGIGDPSFVNYIGYIFFAGSTVILINGFTFYIFPFELASWLNNHLMMAHFSNLAFAVRFAIAFLRFDNVKPWFVRLGERFSWLLFGFAASALVLSEAFLTPIYFVSIACVYIYAISLMSKVIGSRLMWVRYYLASWLPLFVGAGVSIAAFNGAMAYNFITRNGAMLGVLAEICIMAIAIMDRFRANEVDKEFKAHHDQVTGLPNSVALNLMISKLTREKQTFTLVVFDVPQARDIIPSLGVQSANRFFIDLFNNVENYADGLSSVLEFEKNIQNNIFHLARVGDSSFAIIFVGELSDEALSFNILTVQEAVSTLIDVNGASVSVGCHAGVVSYPQDSTEKENLLALALQALLEGPHTEQKWARFDQTKSVNMRKRFELAADLQSAIEGDDLELYHQPQIDLNTGNVSGSELLLRWHHAEHGDVPADYMVSIAEETGIIHQLSEWVINKGFSQQAKLYRLGFEHTVSINISGKDLNNHGLIAHILTSIAEYNLPPESVVFEITESATADDPELAKKVVTELHQQGFKIAIDDFGTGYSSLDYLSQLPFHELKIDKCFMNLESSDRNRTITEMTVTLGSRLGVAVVAEGVESDAIASLLQEFGCPYGQGYLYAKPMPFLDYMRWLQNESKRTLTA